MHDLSVASGRLPAHLTPLDEEYVRHLAEEGRPFFRGSLSGTDVSIRAIFPLKSSTSEPTQWETTLKVSQAEIELSP